MYFSYDHGLNLETNSFTKKSEHSKENSPLQAKKSLDFVKCFREFVKGIYETCNCNFFNLALTTVAVVFSVYSSYFFFMFC